MGEKKRQTCTSRRPRDTSISPADEGRSSFHVLSAEMAGIWHITSSPATSDLPSPLSLFPPTIDDYPPRLNSRRGYPRYLIHLLLQQLRQRRISQMPTVLSRKLTYPMLGEVLGIDPPRPGLPRHFCRLWGRLGRCHSIGGTSVLVCITVSGTYHSRHGAAGFRNL